MAVHPFPLSPAVIPVSRHAKTGTHTRAPLQADLCSWVPDKRCALSGMTDFGG
jgi:hypothetical protein